jgi:hypothetical protein
LTGQSHDYKRHGTTTLFAALDVAIGRIIAAHSKRRCPVESLGFMNSVVAALLIPVDGLFQPPTRWRSLANHRTAIALP